MSYFGAYFGSTGEAAVVVEETPPVPVEIAIVFGDPLYLDFELRALDRLPQQYRSNE